MAANCAFIVHRNCKWKLLRTKENSTECSKGCGLEPARDPFIMQAMCKVQSIRVAEAESEAQAE